MFLELKSGRVSRASPMASILYGKWKITTFPDVSFPFIWGCRWIYSTNGKWCGLIWKIDYFLFTLQLSPDSSEEYMGTLCVLHGIVSRAKYSDKTEYHDPSKGPQDPQHPVPTRWPSPGALWELGSHGHCWGFLWLWPAFLPTRVSTPLGGLSITLSSLWSSTDSPGCHSLLCPPLTSPNLSTPTLQWPLVWICWSTVPEVIPPAPRYLLSLAKQKKKEPRGKKEGA